MSAADKASLDSLAGDVATIKADGLMPEKYKTQLDSTPDTVYQCARDAAQYWIKAWTGTYSDFQSAYEAATSGSSSSSQSTGSETPDDEEGSTDA